MLQPSAAVSIVLSGTAAQCAAAPATAQHLLATRVGTVANGAPGTIVRAFVGMEIALQALYFGTSSPLGYDLTNGIWARLGY